MLAPFFGVLNLPADSLGISVPRSLGTIQAAILQPIYITTRTGTYDSAVVFSPFRDYIPPASVMFPSSHLQPYQCAYDAARKERKDEISGVNLSPGNNMDQDECMEYSTRT
ncbi:hypothetical protein Pdw03_8315 [Penicillium digitatum]|uniref:Uncharacterized protein n=1 Tax=Penicillium digitatum TaxID=36651 RepID=A0A7T6XNG3_PENDI|nr:hypothetical protein Pdw03_8315 [Penicillium digitatum]